MAVPLPGDAIIDTGSQCTDRKKTPILLFTKSITEFRIFRHDHRSMESSNRMGSTRVKALRQPLSCTNIICSALRHRVFRGHEDVPWLRREAEVVQTRSQLRANGKEKRGSRSFDCLSTQMFRSSKLTSWIAYVCYSRLFARI